ncbi:nitrite/sulfite reductase [Veillonella criceti]|uniref:Sulfite reductase [ferredoxin] n=1 Tax=Veillonella criceti TaxID=103891 RepID=A0A380NP78_9FIRM|nr:nitrite/sulfite reductase [Veillonella criceti]SUP44682.1 Sulfite reductase [ferredoxin] [Veillonella criceti]
MTFLTNEVKERLIKDLPSFAKTSEQFFNKEISVNDYKGLSGPFGTYAERGANTAMYRLRLPGGRITQQQLAFLADMFTRFELPHLHFTTGQSIQIHGLQGPQVVEMFRECHAHGIYSRGGGGDHPRNIAASPLRGVVAGEPFDITPYVQIASEYILTLIPDFKMPRKLKIAFTNGLENSTHVTFKDLGFWAQADGTFTVYAAGGLGGNPRKGILLAEKVDPAEILYYIKAMVRTFIENADYKTRSKNRTRYMVADMGEDKFRETFNKFLTFVKRTENLSFELPETAITKTGTEHLTDEELAKANGLIGEQVQDGLYYVYYHPVGGHAQPVVARDVFQYVGSLEGAEARMTSEEGTYFINLTATEARKVYELIKDDSSTSEFSASVCCVGAAKCQVGFQNSQAAYKDILAHLAAEGIDDSLLPKIHMSGCPSSCGTHQIGTLGLHGFVKQVDGKPQPAFNLFKGGSDALGFVTFGEPLGAITTADLPAFFADLANTLNKAGQPYDTWIKDHSDDFETLAKKYI